MLPAPFEQPLIAALERALHGVPQLLHVIIGPRQVGKTTAALAVRARWDGPTRYAAADEFVPAGPEWIRHQWDLARRAAADGPVLLVLDEVQKVTGWSEVVKAEWDADRREGRAIRVVLLGSSALLVGHGTTESLAGRFLLHRAPHWTFPQCRAAFGWDLERYLFFGGYPGAAALAADVDLWRRHVRDALVEPAIARDVLALETVAKPALLRQVFALACRLPARVVSYNKLVGQLQDAGNTTTVAGYLELLSRAFLVSGLKRYSGSEPRTYAASPKLVVWTNALVAALDARPPEELRADAADWGHLVENAVGAHLLAGLQDIGHEVLYWRDGPAEVDYVVRSGRTLWAIEVKSGRPRSPSGLAAFCRRHPEARPLIVGPGGMPLAEFLEAAPAALLA